MNGSNMGNRIKERWKGRWIVADIVVDNLCEENRQK